MAPAFEGHLGKFRKLVPALAVVIHVAECQVGSVSLFQCHNKAVSDGTTAR